VNYLNTNLIIQYQKNRVPGFYFIKIKREETIVYFYNLLPWKYGIQQQDYKSEKIIRKTVLFINYKYCEDIIFGRLQFWELISLTDQR